MKQQIFGLLIAASLSGCAGSVKEVSCAGLDWEDFGYQTGKKGKSVRTFDPYRDGCGENLEPGAMNQYLDGYTRGIIEFCTYENGYELGSENKALPDVCPTELKPAFAKGHSVGIIEFREKLSKLKRFNEDEASMQERTSAEKATDTSYGK